MLEVNFVLPLELVLKTGIFPGLAAWIKGFISPLHSLSEGKWLWWSSGAKEAHLKPGPRLVYFDCMPVLCSRGGAGTLTWS